MAVQTLTHTAAADERPETLQNMHKQIEDVGPALEAHSNS